LWDGSKSGWAIHVFDRHACTGGEAARFLRAMLDDLALAG